MIDLGTIYLRPRKEPWPAENRRAHVEEVEAGKFVSDVEVCFEECANSADVLPVPLEDVRINPKVFNGLGNDMLAKVGQIVFKKSKYHLPAKNVDSHRGQK